MSTGQETYRVAVLHQAAPTPAIGGVLKPVKPGGYKDSCADLAYALHLESTKSDDIELVTPVPNPDPTNESDWSFGDFKSTMLSAIEEHGVNVLWANTNVHSTHALLEVAKLHPDVRMVSQDPRKVDQYDDKAWANRWLAAQHPDLAGAFSDSWIVARGDLGALDGIPLPAVIKPVRGRGSQGVALCHSRADLHAHAQKLWQTGERVIVESFLAGEEVTVAVLPPGRYDAPVGTKDKHWAFPVVRRFDQKDGVMPYSGGVPVTANSVLVSAEEANNDPEYARLQRRCELVGDALGTLATMRIDARRRGLGKSGRDAEFALFDINMKPNITGPDRPGRQAQTALTGMAAEGLGWSYRDMVRNMLRQGVKLRCLV